MGTGILSGLAMIVGLAWIILQAAKMDVDYEKNRVKMREEWREEARDQYRNKRTK